MRPGMATQQEEAEHRLLVARVEAEGIRAERDAALTELATAGAELCRTVTTWLRNNREWPR